MTIKRRRFVELGLATAASMVGCGPSRSGTTPPGGATGDGPAPKAEPTPDPGIKTLLVLGGTRFLGPAVVDEALAAGLEVTLFNRGKSNPDAYPELETLIGDRDPDVGAGLSALEGRQWDAVIDTSGYFPRMVEASAGLLAEHARQYVFVSSVSAYADHTTPQADEDAPLAELADPTVETMGEQWENYGGLKVLCEQAAERAMPGKVANVRPGYIVGPLDPTDRFTYWPWRMAQGGDMVVPGSPDDPIQVIDVRDLGRWLVELVVGQTHGVFNAVGPASPTTMGAVIEACRAATGGDTNVVWAALEELEKREEPLPFPIWAPPSGDSAGFHLRSNERATTAGLTFRPLDEIVGDLWQWFRSQPAERSATPRAGLSPELEKQLLASLRGS